MSNWYVLVKESDTDKLVQKFGPYSSERQADRVDGGLNAKLNHEKFYTEISEDKQ